MTETTMATTTPEVVFARQLPLALQALGVHMQMHALPPFHLLDFVDQQIVVHLHGPTAPAWLTSVEIDAERTEERDLSGQPATRHEYEVRLPDTGFRFTLVAFRPVPDWRVAS